MNILKYLRSTATKIKYILINGKKDKERIKKVKKLNTSTKENNLVKHFRNAVILDVFNFS